MDDAETMDELDELNVAELSSRLHHDRMEGKRFGPFQKDGLCNAEVGENVYCWEPTTGADRCDLHGGAIVDDEGNRIQEKHPKEVEDHPDHWDNGIKHWLNTSAMTFLHHADEEYKDMYTVFLASLVEQYEEAHGTRPKPHHLGQLDEVAFNMVKLRLSREYEKEQAVNKSIPLTETKIEDIGGEPMEIEVINRVNKMKKDIRRENRLALKDMGIGPESTAEEEEEEETEEVISWDEDLQEGTE